MWEQLTELGKSRLTLSEKLSQHDEDISEIRHELYRMSIFVHRLADNVKHFTETERLERENHELRMQMLLKELERRLPPPHH